MSKNKTKNPLEEYNYPQVPAKAGEEIGNDGANNDMLEKLIERKYYGHPVINIYNKVAELEGLRFDDDNVITSAKVMVNIMRFVFGFDANLLYTLIKMLNPNVHYGLLEEMCKNACTDLKFKGQPKVLKDAVKELDEENKEEGESEGSGDVKLIMPRLPKALEVIVSKFEGPFKEAVLFSSLAFFSVHANDIWVLYNGTELYKILFAVNVLGVSAVGKSAIDKVKDMIIGVIIERDEKYYEEEQEAKEKDDAPKPRGRKKKGETADENTDDKEEKKHRPIQYLGSTTSITAIAYRAKCGKGLTLIMYDNEGEAMFLSCQRGASTNIWIMLRKGVEGSEYTQGHHGKDTFSGICHPFISHVICVQPEIAIPVLNRHISNGYTSRVFFPEIKQEIGARRPRVKEFTDKDIAIIKDACLKLESTKEEGLVLKKVGKALDHWLNERAMEAIKKCNHAIDHYRKRAATTAYKAAALYYYLDNQRETKHTVEFAIYCAEFMLRKQLYYFGDEFNRLKKEGKKGGCTTNNVNYYEKLGEVFTAMELVELRKMNSESTNVRMIISRWRTAGLIEDVEGKRATYRKVHHD